MNPFNQSEAIQYVNVFVLPATLFHGPELSLEIKPSLLPVGQYSLPESVRSAETLASFKHKLKTYLFNITF